MYICSVLPSVAFNVMQAAMKKELEETKLPGALQFFEKLSAKSGASEGWLFGKVGIQLCPKEY